MITKSNTLSTENHSFKPVKKYILLIALSVISAYLTGATPDTLMVLSDTNQPVLDITDSVDIDITFDANVKEVLNLNYVKNSYQERPNYDSTSENPNLIPTFNDSVYIDRLSRIPSIANLNYNSIVKRYIEVYTVKKRKSVELMLGLSEHYFPLFDDIFDYYDVPNEMKYMAIIESALNPRAYSRARAVGLWQFMYGTGKVYGLEINSLVDERRDPIKSTHAAARYIKNLHKMYDDWLLALAAYNCGPGNVNKAIRRSGGKKDFWQIYYYLPRETRGHVPAFIAATYTMNYYKEHNLSPASVSLPMNTDTVMIGKKLHLEQVASVLNVPVKEIRDLNPQYRYDIVPGNNTKAYALRLPEKTALSFIDLQDSIFAYKDSLYLKATVVSKPSHSYDIPNMPGKNYVKLTYKVKSGDAVGLIAQWYDVKTSNLRYWNNIRRNLIRSGQTLHIYKHKNVAAKYKGINTMSYAQKQARIGKSVPSSSSSITVQAPLSGSDSDYVMYTVRSGDTIWEIAQMFPGVSDSDIMRLNNITNAGSIKPGQKLRIKRKS